MNRAFLALILAVALASYASASTYYADIEVDVDASGAAQISGITNHPALSPGKTDALTSKRGALWLFNLTLPREDVFSDYVYAVDLPAGAQVIYVRADSFRITSPNGRIRVSGSGKDGPISVVVQYQIADSGASDHSPYLLLIAAPVLLVLALLLFFLRKKKPEKKVAEVQDLQVPKEEKEEVTNKVSSQPVSANYSKYQGILTDRQEEILRIVSEAGKPVNQALICERLDLPKSSVSRNVASLVDLGILEKKKVGMSTFLSLKKE